MRFQSAHLHGKFDQGYIAGDVPQMPYVTKLSAGRIQIDWDAMPESRLLLELNSVEAKELCAQLTSATNNQRRARWWQFR